MKKGSTQTIARAVKIYLKDIIVSCKSFSSYIFVLFLLVKGDRSLNFYSHGREDQSGSRIHDEIMAKAFCFMNGIRYCGPVFKQLPSYDETEPLRQLLGLPAASLSAKGVIMPQAIYRERESKGISAILDAAISNTLPVRLGAHPDEIFSERYVLELQQKLTLSLETRINEVVLHARRGDVSAEMHPNRYTGIRYYLDLINQLSELDPLLRFTVHSQSKGLSSSEIEALSAICTLVLDADLVKAWEDMIKAEILVLAKSSFSYVPALYSVGTIIYQPFWHLPRSNWYNLEDLQLPQIIKIVHAKRTANASSYYD